MDGAIVRQYGCEVSKKMDRLVGAAESVVIQLGLLIAEKERQLEQTRPEFSTVRLDRQNEIERLLSLQRLLSQELDSLRPDHRWLRHLLMGVGLVISPMFVGGLEEFGASAAAQIMEEVTQLAQGDDDSRDAEQAAVDPVVLEEEIESATVDLEQSMERVNSAEHDLFEAERAASRDHSYHRRMVDKGGPDYASDHLINQEFEEAYLVLEDARREVAAKKEHLDALTRRQRNSGS